ncbi:MAG: glycoside hydrolase family 5 protein [Polyangiaceae bacterium]|nr:glycoside hydrolase family 5 protein [Polyangiaceae bacterium]
MNKPLLALALTSVALLIGGCGDGAEPSTGGGSAGEDPYSGGAPDSGGSSSGGQVGGTGGAAGANPSSGGTSSSSGGEATGGEATGGAATGGTEAGGSSTGGRTARGGRSGSGGTSASGGASGSGGAIGSGGTTASGGLAGSGGTTGSGGSSATGGGGTTGQLTPEQAVKLMSPGWNLGNSFDAIPNETSWGNPTPSQTLVKAVHAAGFKLLRLATGWTDHIGPAPSYTIDSAWMNKVKQTAQWAVDDGMYVFLNTHHDSDGGGNGGWVTFPSTTSAAQSVATEVTAVWTQIATAFQSFDSRLMFECFNEPNYRGNNNAQSQEVLNLYLEACFKAIRDTGGANATRIVMIQPIGASPIQAGIQAIQKVSFIKDPNLVISLHTYYPTNFGLSTTPYSWGSASDYASMRDSIEREIRVWLPTQVIFIGEWGSMAAQPAANRAAHAQAYAQDTTTAGLVPIWWDNGGSGNESFSLFNRNTGDVTQSAIVSGIMTGVKDGLASPNNWATKP